VAGNLKVYQDFFFIIKSDCQELFIAKKYKKKVYSKMISPESIVMIIKSSVKIGKLASLANCNK